MLPRVLTRFLSALPNLPRALRLAREASGSRPLVWTGLLAVQGLLPLVTVLLTRSVVDRLALLLRFPEHAPTLPLLLVGAAYAAALLASELVSAASRTVRALHVEELKDHVAARVQDESIAADIAFFESPEFHDRLHRARDESAFRAAALVENLGGAAQSAITLVAMLGVLIPLGPVTALALLASTLPVVVLLVRHARREHLWWVEHTRDERRSWYLTWLLTLGENAGEVRVFGLGPALRAQFDALRAHLRDGRRVLERDRSATTARAAAVSLVAGAAAALWMLHDALAGRLTLGDLAMAYQAFALGQGRLRELLAHATEVYGNLLFVGGLLEFLDLEPEVVDPPSPLPGPVIPRESVRFERVTFSYPTSTRTAVEDLDLEIPAGSITAIVGSNGSGKSTLVRLLCRFYDPSSGRVLVDGVDVRCFARKDLRGALSVVFQQPVHYSATVAENVACGDAEVEDAAERLAWAIEAAGASSIVARLPERERTRLGVTFDRGTDLSVGEWQRIAIARALYKRAPILLLDEPTSAMDSWAESAWLDGLRAAAAGRTVLLVTHRFTTAMRADRIHVMEDGRVIESGSHDELVRAGGGYARSWRAQTETGERATPARREGSEASSAPVRVVSGISRP